MSAWNDYDIKASWVAVFLLLLFWWLSYVPLMFASGSKKSEDSYGTPVEVEDEQKRRFQRIAHHFRDGLTFLLAATVIDFAAAGPPDASNALAWVFTAIWTILAVLMVFVKWYRLVNLLAFLDLILIVAIVSNAFANASGRTTTVST